MVVRRAAGLPSARSALHEGLEAFKFGCRTMSLCSAGGEMACNPEHGLVPESGFCPGGNSLRSLGLEDWKQKKPGIKEELFHVG